VQGTEFNTQYDKERKKERKKERNTQTVTKKCERGFKDTLKFCDLNILRFIDDLN
jgi:hypothetical protein